MKIYPRIFSFHSTKVLTIVTILLVLAGILFFTIFIQQKLAHQATLPPDLIRMENAKRGTAGWRVTKQASNQIQAYTEEPSINTGEVAHLYVSTSSPSFSIDIYRYGYGVGNLFDWTYSMLRFLEQNGYDVTYTTNDAVSEGLTNLMNYKGFVVGGHDEYWDYSERHKVEQAISKGMSLASFSANVMYWQIRYTTVPNTNHKAIICYKYPELDPYSTQLDFIQ
jgi:hypothetical protein